MLTFISGWRGVERDKAVLNQRDITRPAVFFIDDASRFPGLLPDAEVIDLWRNGRMEFQLGQVCETLIRINYDTEQDLIWRAVSHTLFSGADAQIIVTYNATSSLARLFPALRSMNALLVADERLDAPAGDRVLFTRGGSFHWTDHLLESQTALLTEDEILDGGIVPDPDEEAYPALE